MESTSIGKLAAALAKAQGVMGGARKDTKGNFGKYATLESIWDACRAPLSQHELAVVQLVEAAGKVVTVRTALLHSSGECLETSISSEAKDAGPQAIGSVITYLRRYSLAAMVGIAPEDDDGHAGQNGEQPAKVQPAQQPVRTPMPIAPPPSIASADAEPISTKTLQVLAMHCDRVFGDTPADTERARKLIGDKVSRPISSRKDLSEAEGLSVIKGLEKTPSGKYAAKEGATA